MAKSKLDAVLENYKAMSTLQQSIKTVLKDGTRGWNKETTLKMSKALTDCAVSTNQIVESMLND